MNKGACCGRNFSDEHAGKSIKVAATFVMIRMENGEYTRLS